MYELKENLKVTKELALVKMCQEIKLNQLLECPELRWSQTGQAYVVIETEDVLRAVQVIPHFKKEGNFFVNTFKFWCLPQNLQIFLEVNGHTSPLVNIIA